MSIFNWPAGRNQLWILAVSTLLALATATHASRSATSQTAEEGGTGAPASIASSEAYCLVVPSREGDAYHALVSNAVYREVAAEGLAEGQVCVGLFADRDTATRTIGLFFPHTGGDVRVHPLASEELTVARRGQSVFVGPPRDLSGNVQIGPNQLERGTTRDVVAVFYMDTFEGEPSVGDLWVLDGAAGRVQYRAAWDAILLPDQNRLLYARDHLVVDESGDDPVDRRDLVARSIGVAPEVVDEASFADGFVGSTHVAQPVLLDLDGGADRPLPLVGGGDLALIGGDVAGVLRPWFWAFPDWEDESQYERWQRLDLEAMTWSPLPMPPGPSPSHTVWREYPSVADPTALGQVVVQTKDGRLGLVVVALPWVVQAAFLSVGEGSP